MALVVRPSKIHSVGVFTNAAIRKGVRIIEYTGPRISAEEADRRYEGAPRTYLYGLGDGKIIIDGEGIAAYLNHSCEPNCEIDEIKGRAFIFAIRDIAPGKSCSGITTYTMTRILRPVTAARSNAAGPCIPAIGWLSCGARPPGRRNVNQRRTARARHEVAAKKSRVRKTDLGRKRAAIHSAS